MKEVLTLRTLLRLAAIAGLLGLTGCPDSVSPQISHAHSLSVSNVSLGKSADEQHSSGAEAYSAQTLKNSSQHAATSMLTTVVADASKGARKLETTVCARLPNWQRPSETAHLQELEAMPRYGQAIYNEPLISLFNQFRNHSVIHFTTYGLSARIEPIYLSGIAPVMDSLWSCYDEDVVGRINTGQVGEIWLMNYELVSMNWTGRNYIAVVKAVDQGLEIVQFERQEVDATLPIKILTSEGQEVESMSGDW